MSKPILHSKIEQLLDAVPRAYWAKGEPSRPEHRDICVDRARDQRPDRYGELRPATRFVLRTARQPFDGLAPIRKTCKMERGLFVADIYLREERDPARPYPLLDESAGGIAFVQLLASAPKIIRQLLGEITQLEAELTKLRSEK